MQIKVLIISDYSSGLAARPEAEIFIGLQKIGMQITVMTHENSPYSELFRQAGVRVIGYHPPKKFSQEAVKRIREELIAGQYHILHLFNSKAIINGIRAARHLPVNVVLYRGYTGNIHWYDPSAYLKFLHPRVDKITCLAKSIEEDFQRQLFFDKRKAITINKGHAAEWYRDVTPINRTELPIPENAFVVACVANARPMKGIPYLIQATYHLPTDLPIHFLLVGENMDDPAIQKLIDNSPNNEKIHQMGFRRDALQIVAASNVFALTSVKGEATTKALLEAMFLGVTPVITDIPGNRGVVIPNQSGLVVPPHDAEAVAQAILHLYRHPDLSEQLGKNAQRHVEENFNVKDTILKMKALYESLAAN